MTDIKNRFAQADEITSLFKVLGLPTYGEGSIRLNIELGVNLKQLSYLRKVLGDAAIAQAEKANNKKLEETVISEEEGKKAVFLQAIAEGLHEVYKLARPGAVSASPLLSHRLTEQELADLDAALGLEPVTKGLKELRLALEYAALLRGQPKD